MIYYWVKKMVFCPLLGALYGAQIGDNIKEDPI